MRALIFSLLLLAATGEVLMTFLKEGSGLRKYISSVFALLLLSAFLVPAVSAVKKSVAALPDTIEPAAQAAAISAEGEQSDMILSETKTVMIGNVMSALHTKFSIPLNAVRVSISFADEDRQQVTIEKIHIALLGNEYAILKEKAERYIGELFSCPCEVTT